MQTRELALRVRYTTSNLISGVSRLIIWRLDDWGGSRSTWTEKLVSRVNGSGCKATKLLVGVMRRGFTVNATSSDARIELIWIGNGKEVGGELFEEIDELEFSLANGGVLAPSAGSELRLPHPSNDNDVFERTAA